MFEPLKDFYSGKTILVTGGAGAIGANLVRALLSLHVQHVFVIDNLSSGYEKNIQGLPRTTFIKGDINDREVLRAAFSQGVEIVFHSAAFFANQNSIDNPLTDAKSNILGTITLLEESRAHDIELFVYLNTSCVYNPDTTDWTEWSRDIHHDTPYSISKYTAEQYVKFFYKYYRLPVVSARIFNSYGPYEYPGRYRNVIPNFFTTAMKGESLTITGTGQETRSFTFVDDTVSGLLLSGARYDGSWQIYNIGSSRETKIIDLAKKINTLTGNTAPIIFAPRRDWDKSLRRRPNVSKAKKRLGFTPSISLDEGLSRTYAWFTTLKPS